MPVYEFVCRECEKPFEIVRKMSDAPSTPPCPSCGSTRVDRVWSSVYTKTSRKS
jgi:putative FmdB family regulatory protein